MSRFRPGKAYGHDIEWLGHGDYRISWVYDRYYEGSRLRQPTRIKRDTDEDGARRFAKKHGIEMPEPKS